MTTKLELLNQIIEREREQTIKEHDNKIKISIFEAAIILRTYNNLNEEDKLKFMELEWKKILELAYSQTLEKLIK